MTEENQLSFSYLEGCLRWAQKGHVGLDYDRPFQIQVFTMNKLTKQIGCDRPQQILASFYLYTYLTSLTIIIDQERKQSYFHFEGVSWTYNELSRKGLIFVCKSTAHSRRMLKYAYVFKNRTIELLLFCEVIADISYFRKYLSFA